TLFKLLVLCITPESDRFRLVDQGVGTVAVRVDGLQILIQEAALIAVGAVADAGAAGGAESPRNRCHPGAQALRLEGLAAEHGAQMGVKCGEILLHISGSVSG